MKRILLELMNFSAQGNNSESCHDICMFLREGETIALLGERNSGRYSFFGWLSGENTEYSGQVISDTDISTERFLRNNVFLLSDSLRLKIVENSSILLEDYLFLMSSSGCSGFMIRKEKMEEKGRELLLEVGLERKLQDEMSIFTPMERLKAELAKAIYSGARIIALENDLEGLNDSEIDELSELVGRIKSAHHLCIVWNTNGMRGIAKIADRCMYFFGGTIVKQVDMKRPGGMQKVENIAREDILIPAVRKTENKQEELPFFQADVCVNQVPFELEIRHGQIYSIVEYDLHAKRKLFEIMTGEKYSDLRFHGEKLPEGWYFRKNRYPIIGLDVFGINGEFSNLTPAENIILPSYRKISSPSLFFPSSALHAAGIDWRKKHPNAAESVSEMNRADRLSVQLEGIITFHPELLICYEPFLHLDRQGRGLFAQCFSTLTARNSSVIIITSSMTNYLGEDSMVKDSEFLTEIIYEQEGRICIEK
jgi:ABC-type sugar transport system ATPase subunit